MRSNLIRSDLYGAVVTGSVCCLLTLILWFVYIFVPLDSANDREHICHVLKILSPCRRTSTPLVLCVCVLVLSRLSISIVQFSSVWGPDVVQGRTDKTTYLLTWQTFICLSCWVHISRSLWWCVVLARWCWFNGCWHEGISWIRAVISYFATVTIFLGVVRWSEIADRKGTRVGLFWTGSDNRFLFVANRWFFVHWIWVLVAKSSDWRS